MWYWYVHWVGIVKEKFGPRAKGEGRGASLRSVLRQKFQRAKGEGRGAPFDPFCGRNFREQRAKGGGPLRSVGWVPPSGPNGFDFALMNFINILIFIRKI